LFGKRLSRRGAGVGTLFRVERNWLLLTVALGGAGFVQGLSGFGFGLVSMSIMPLFMGVKQAAVLSTTFMLLATVATFVRHARDYDWRLGIMFLASVCLGLPVGVYFLEKSSERLLIKALGGLMLAYTLREFLVPAASRNFHKAWTIPLGLFSGVMSGAFNLGGVPSAAYAYSQPWSRGQIIAFLQVMITTVAGLRMLFYLKSGLLGGIPWGLGARAFSFSSASRGRITCFCTDERPRFANAGLECGRCPAGHQSACGR
jgi:uncharacterized membrane protein YfcA